MNGRKGLSLVLSGAMMVSMLSLPAMAADTAAPEFPDAAGSWASESIDRWGAAGVVNGDENGNFNPTASITRAELAQIFVNMFGLTEKAPNTYADLRGDEWYADAILKCTAAGIMQGDGVNANPMAMISRQETMVMFGRAMGVTPVENPDLSGFTDGASVADWAAGYMAPLAEMGIITGSGDGSIQPSVNIDRASTMALLDKAITVYINEPGEYSVDNEKGFVVVATDGEVKITGKTAGVVVTAGCTTGTVKLNGVTADTVKVDGTAAVSLENGTAVETVSVNSAAAVDVASGVKVETMEVNADADISNAGTITTLEANSAADVKNTGTIRTLDAGAAVRVDNSGTISKAEINADGVILDGRRPSTIDVADGVKNPTDSKGNEIKDNTSGGGGGDYYPPSTETVGGIVGVNPVDQSGTITEMPTITASAYKTLATSIITIDLSSSDVVPVHENAQHTKGSWVGFAIKAPEGVTSAYYTFGTEASDTASSPVELTTGDPNVGGGAEGEYYFVAFVNATAVTPKTYLTIDWDGEGEKYAPQKYEINLASVKTDVQKLENVTISLDKLPEGVQSSETGLAFDGSTALVSNGGSGTLTQEQVKGMGGGGEYTVYYAVPQEGLEFDKIVRTVNGKDTEWSISSDTAADAGEGWWTKDDSNYYFKWGAVFAQKNEQGIWEMTDNGKYNYTIRFVKDGNVVATYSFSVDLSGYTIGKPETVADVKVQTNGWVDGSSATIARDEAHELDLSEKVSLTQADVAGRNGELVEYSGVPTEKLSEADTVVRTVSRPGVDTLGTATMTFEALKGDSRMGTLTEDDGYTYFKFGTTFAEQKDGVWGVKGTGDYTETLTFLKDGVAIATCSYTIKAGNISISNELPGAITAAQTPVWSAETPNKENVNEMMTALWAEGPTEVQGISVSQVFSWSDGTLTINKDNVTEGILNWITTQWGGTSVPVALTIDGQYTVTGDANWSNAVLVWVDLKTVETGAMTVELSNGGVTTLNVAVTSSAD